MKLGQQHTGKHTEHETERVDSLGLRLAIFTDKAEEKNKTKYEKAHEKKSQRENSIIRSIGFEKSRDKTV